MNTLLRLPCTNRQKARQISLHSIQLKELSISSGHCPPCLLDPEEYSALYRPVQWLHLSFSPVWLYSAANDERGGAMQCLVISASIFSLAVTISLPMINWMRMMKSSPSSDDDEDAKTQHLHLPCVETRSVQGFVHLPTDETLGPYLPPLFPPV